MSFYVARARSEERAARRLWRRAEEMAALGSRFEGSYFDAFGRAAMCLYAVAADYRAAAASDREAEQRKEAA